jgi:hypothetical protein
MWSRGCIRAVSALAVLALLSGCDTLRGLLGEDEQAAAPVVVPQPSSEPEPVVIATPAPPPPAPAPRERPQAPADFDPAKLVGLGKDQTLVLLGQPAAVREQPPATVWTYRTRECALDVFFYMDLSTRAFRVLTTEVTSELKSADARRTCLNRLRTASRGQ